MKKIVYFFSILIIFYSNQLFSVEYNSEPKIFIEELVNDALKILGNKSLSEDEKSKQIEKIATENVDIKALGLYTLGEKRKSLEPEKLKSYQNLFERYFLKTLTSRLSEYSSQKFEILDSDQKSSNYTIVMTRIVENVKTPEIKVDWRVYTKNPQKPLIRDLIVEGLSLARTQKEEFSSILNSNNNDIEALMNKLEEFISD